jgi:hypothetical protein
MKEHQVLTVQTPTHGNDIRGNLQRDVYMHGENQNETLY